MLGRHIDFSIFHDNYDESVIKLACLCGRRHWRHLTSHSRQSTDEHNRCDRTNCNHIVIINSIITTIINISSSSSISIINVIMSVSEQVLSINVWDIYDNVIITIITSEDGKERLTRRSVAVTVSYECEHRECLVAPTHTHSHLHTHTHSLSLSWLSPTRVLYLSKFCHRSSKTQQISQQMILLHSTMTVWWCVAHVISHLLW